MQDIILRLIMVITVGKGKSKMGKGALILIPAYNEEASICKVLDAIMATSIPQMADILVVDDGSSDHTTQVVASYDVILMSLIMNRGYGSAIQAGYKYADEKGYDYVIQLDADGQHDIANVQHIYEALIQGEEKERPDIVIGSRFLSEQSSFRPSGLKKVVIRFFRGIIQKITGTTITDPTSGLQGLNRRTFAYYSGYGQFDYRYPDINMIIQMLLKGYVIKEIPAIMHERTTGQSMHSGYIKQLKYMIIITLSTVSIILRQWKETSIEARKERK